jgi:hypothetical protein
MICIYSDLIVLVISEKPASHASSMNLAGGGGHLRLVVVKVEAKLAGATPRLLRVDKALVNAASMNMVEHMSSPT